MIMEINEAIIQIREKAGEEKEYIITQMEDGREFYDIEQEQCAEEYDQLADWLEELKWYREQDLIRREDANNILYDEPIMDVDGTCYGMKKPSLNTIKERLTNIPKAEPLKRWSK